MRYPIRPSKRSWTITTTFSSTRMRKLRKGARRRLNLGLPFMCCCLSLFFASFPGGSFTFRFLSVVPRRLFSYTLSMGSGHPKSFFFFLRAHSTGNLQLAVLFFLQVAGHFFFLVTTLSLSFFSSEPLDLVPSRPNRREIPLTRLFFSFIFF